MSKESGARPRVVVVMPAYNAAATLARTYNDMPRHAFDEVVLVDDASQDDTAQLAEALGLTVLRHPVNRGYGANQKSCYRYALAGGADIIVMLHPDYQYDPKILPSLIAPIREGTADVVLASRMLGDPLRGGPLQNGMPLYKYAFNRMLTLVQNRVLGTYFSEFHTGYRAFSRRALEAVPFDRNADGFVFDNQMIVQLLLAKCRFKETPVITNYHAEASSVDFRTSVAYGLGVSRTIFQAYLHLQGRASYGYLQVRPLEPPNAAEPFGAKQATSYSNG